MLLLQVFFSLQISYFVHVGKERKYLLSYDYITFTHSLTRAARNLPTTIEKFAKMAQSCAITIATTTSMCEREEREHHVKLGEECDSRVPFRANGQCTRMSSTMNSWPTLGWKTRFAQLWALNLPHHQHAHWRRPTQAFCFESNKLYSKKVISDWFKGYAK